MQRSINEYSDLLDFLCKSNYASSIGYACCDRNSWTAGEAPQAFPTELWADHLTAAGTDGWPAMPLSRKPTITSVMPKITA